MIALLNSIIPLLSAAAIALQPPAPGAAQSPPRQPASAPALAPAGQPPATPSPQNAPPPVVAAPINPEIDALLNKLEHAVDDLHAFTADVLLTKYDPVMDRVERTAGRVIYHVQPAVDAQTAAAKRFAIQFDTLQEGSRKQAINQHFIFDGAWLVEINADRKQFFKRRIVPPGKTLDPLKLGEGPFPLPLGQPKQEVLARFDVQLIEAPVDGPLKGLQNVDGVRLIPKPETKAAGEFQSIDLFYDRDLQLPVGIESIAAQQLDPNDPASRERKTVRLSNLQRNPQLKPDQLQLLVIDDNPPEGWEVDIAPWKGED